MALTFLEIKKLVANYTGRAGKCITSPEVSTFARQVLENLLISGSYAGLRRLDILAAKGVIALPPEVEVLLKAKVNNRVAEIWSQWFSFHSVSDNFERSCCPIGEVLIQDGSQTPIAYPLPATGSLLGVLGHCDEADDASIVIQGKDTTGRPIYTSFNGNQVPGEKLRIKNGELRYGKTLFGQIETVLKSRTNGYVTLFAVDPAANQRVLLADYSPVEEKPLYQKYRLVSRNCAPIVHLSILCRVRLKDNYHDNDVTFFDNSLAITLAAQRLQAETNSDVATANYKRQAVEDTLEKEAGYKRTSGGPMDVFVPLSGGSIRNIV